MLLKENKYVCFLSSVFHYYKFNSEYAFITESAVLDKIINHLKLSFTAKSLPLPYLSHQLSIAVEKSISESLNIYLVLSKKFIPFEFFRGCLNFFPSFSFLALTFVVRYFKEEMKKEIYVKPKRKIPILEANNSGRY